MYVCLCKGITERQIRERVACGASSFEDVQRDLGVATQCGSCCCLAEEIVADSINQALFESAA